MLLLRLRLLKMLDGFLLHLGVDQSVESVEILSERFLIPVLLENIDEYPRPDNLNAERVGYERDERPKNQEHDRFDKSVEPVM